VIVNLEPHRRADFVSLCLWETLAGTAPAPEAAPDGLSEVPSPLTHSTRRRAATRWRWTSGTMHKGEG